MAESSSLRHLKYTQIFHLGRWSHAGFGFVRFTIAVNDLKVLFQPKFFYGYVNSCPAIKVQAKD